MNKSLVPGSLSDITARQGTTLAQAFMDVDAVIIVDISGSMSACDSRGGRSRWEVANEELKVLQESLPGKLAIIAFSKRSEFIPTGILYSVGHLGNSTNLTGALKYAKMLDVPSVKFIVISDGQPDNEFTALAVAATYTQRIDVVYVGPEGGTGQRFLQRLANSSGGQYVTADRAKELASTTHLLISATA